MDFVTFILLIMGLIGVVGAIVSVIGVVLTEKGKKVKKPRYEASEDIVVGGTIMGVGNPKPRQKPLSRTVTVVSALVGIFFTISFLMTIFTLLLIAAQFHYNHIDAPPTGLWFFVWSGVSSGAYLGFGAFLARPLWKRRAEPLPKGFPAFDEELYDSAPTLLELGFGRVACSS